MLGGGGGGGGGIEIEASVTQQQPLSLSLCLCLCLGVPYSGSPSPLKETRERDSALPPLPPSSILCLYSYYLISLPPLPLLPPPSEEHKPR